MTGMTLGHWLVVAAFVIVMLLPVVFSGKKSKRPEPPCKCADCRGRRAHYADSQRVIE